MFNQFRPGDVEVLSLMLHSDDGSREYDLRQVVRSMDIYESIMSPIIVARLDIQDSFDLLRSFPIITEEYVEFSFRLDGETNPTNLRLHVKEVLDVRINEQQTMKTYTLTLVSQELLDNASRYVNQRFTAEISSSVREILERTLQTTKPMNIEPTKGIDNVLITRQQPLRAIDQLRRRAVSRKYASSSYAFFENKHGINFVTLEGLFDQGARNGVGDKVFFADSNVNDNSLKSTFRNMIAYHQVQFADSIDKIQQGGLNNKVAVMDFKTGGYRVLNFNETQSGDVFKSVNKEPVGQNSSYYTSKHSRTSGKTMLVPYDSSRNALELPEKVSRMQAYTQRIAQNIIQIFIWGDNEITAGDVIEVHFPSAKGTTDTGSRTDRLSSGKFLVAKLRHMFTFGAKPVYTQSCELINGEMFEGA